MSDSMVLATFEGGPFQANGELLKVTVIEAYMGPMLRVEGTWCDPEKPKSTPYEFRYRTYFPMGPLEGLIEQIAKEYMPLHVEFRRKGQPRYVNPEFRANRPEAGQIAFGRAVQAILPQYLKIPEIRAIHRRHLEQQIEWLRGDQARVQAKIDDLRVVLYGDTVRLDRET